MEYYQRGAQGAYISREEEITCAHILIEDAIRQKDSHFVELTGEILYRDMVIEAITSLASVNSFDAMYSIGSAYLRAQGPTNEEDWKNISRLTGAGPTGRLAHLVRLDMAVFDRPNSDVLRSIKEALTDSGDDQDLWKTCRGVASTLPEPIYSQLEKILKK